MLVMILRLESIAVRHKDYLLAHNTPSVSLDRGWMFLPRKRSASDLRYRLPEGLLIGKLEAAASALSRRLTLANKCRQFLVETCSGLPYLNKVAAVRYLRR